MQTRQEAERRYRASLDESFGGAEKVLVAWRIWQDVENANGSDLSEKEYRIARQWLLAADQARQVGLGGLVDLDDAYFEVRPD